MAIPAEEAMNANYVRRTVRGDHKVVLRGPKGTATFVATLVPPGAWYLMDAAGNRRPVVREIGFICDRVVAIARERAGPPGAP